MAPTDDLWRGMGSVGFRENVLVSGEYTVQILLCVHFIIIYMLIILECGT